MTTHDAILRTKTATTLGMCTRRIMATFNQATPDQIEQGAGWYANGNAIVTDIADQGAITVERAAIIVAHLSPRTTWKRNVAGARQLVTERIADHCMSANVKRALAALDADDPWSTFSATSHKIRRFAHNLMGHTDVVTVDVWAMRIATGRGWGKDWRTGDNVETLLGRAGVYEAIERAYLNAGKRLGYNAVTVQATSWIIARGGRTG